MAYTAKLVTEGIRFEYSITENLNENETATTSYVREITNINDETIKVTLPEAEIKKTSIFDGYDLESNQIFIHMKHYVADAKTFVYIDEYHHTDKVSFGNPDSVQINSVNNRKIKMDVNNTNSNIIGYADLSGDKLYMYQPNGEGVYVKSEIPIGNMTLDEYYNNMFAKYIRLLDLATNASDLVYDSATKSYTFTDNSITYTATIVDEGVKFEWSEDENMNNTPSVTTYRLEVNSLYGDVEVVLPTDCITQ